MTYQVPISKTPTYLRIILRGLIVLLCCLIVTFFFRHLGARGMQSIAASVTWTILPALWFIHSYIAIKKWPEATYTLTDDALVVDKDGFFGHSSHSLYRYDTMFTVQATSHNHGEFGTIKITLREGRSLLVRDVSEPSKQASKIKKMITNALP